ncbi:hypothetical protein DY000_02050216, partial [Brassica cretica]
ANSVSAISTAPQWLHSASFTTDLSVIDAAASTAPSLSDVEASEEDEEGDAGRIKKKRDKKKKRKKDSDEYYTKPAKLSIPGTGTGTRNWDGSRNGKCQT